MNIYSFVSQEYTKWKKTGKSSMKFPDLKCIATSPLGTRNYIHLDTKKSIPDTR